MFTSTPITKLFSMKTPTLSSDWVKEITKSIDLLGNLCILSIGNSNITLIQFTTGS